MAGSANRFLAGKTPRAYRFPRGRWQDINPFDHFTPESVAREGVSRTWQDVRLFNAQFLRDNITVAEQGHPGENPILALFAPRLSSRREEKINRNANAMLARLGLAGREDSSADRISLGQSKRVAIARSVSAGARILFLDEPLAGLGSAGYPGCAPVIGIPGQKTTDHPGHRRTPLQPAAPGRSDYHGLAVGEWADQKCGS